MRRVTKSAYMLSSNSFFSVPTCCFHGVLPNKIENVCSYKIEITTPFGESPMSINTVLIGSNHLTLSLHHVICLSITKDNSFWATKEGVKKRGLLRRMFCTGKGCNNQVDPMSWFPEVKVITHVFEEDDICSNHLVCHDSGGILGPFWVTGGTRVKIVCAAIQWTFAMMAQKGSCEHDYIWMKYRISQYVTRPESSLQWRQLRFFSQAPHVAIHAEGEDQGPPVMAGSSLRWCTMVLLCMGCGHPTLLSNYDKVTWLRAWLHSWL